MFCAELITRGAGGVRSGVGVGLSSYRLICLRTAAADAEMKRASIVGEAFAQ
jgi:hypothetical protein